MFVPIFVISKNKKPAALYAAAGRISGVPGYLRCTPSPTRFAHDENGDGGDEKAYPNLKIRWWRAGVNRGTGR
jgi:hypothetical protein